MAGCSIIGPPVDLLNTLWQLILKLIMLPWDPLRQISEFVLPFYISQQFANFHLAMMSQNIATGLESFGFDTIVAQATQTAFIENLSYGFQIATYRAYIASGQFAYD